MVISASGYERLLCIRISLILRTGKNICKELYKSLSGCINSLIIGLRLGLATEAVNACEAMSSGRRKCTEVTLILYLISLFSSFADSCIGWVRELKTTEALAVL